MSINAVGSSLPSPQQIEEVQKIAKEMDEAEKIINEVTKNVLQEGVAGAQKIEGSVLTKPWYHHIDPKVAMAAGIGGVALFYINPVNTVFISAAAVLGYMFHSYENNKLKAQEREHATQERERADQEERKQSVLNSFTSLINTYNKDRMIHLDPSIQPVSFAEKPIKIGRGSPFIAAAIQAIVNVPYLMNNLPEAIESRLVERDLFSDIGAAKVGHDSFKVNPQFAEAKREALKGIAAIFQKKNLEQDELPLNTDDLNTLLNHLQTITNGGLEDLQGLGEVEKANLHKLLVLLELNRIIRTDEVVTERQLQSFYSACQKAGEGSTIPQEPDQIVVRHLIETVIQSIERNSSRVESIDLNDTGPGYEVNFDFPEQLIMQATYPGKDGIPDYSRPPRIFETYKIKFGHKVKSYQTIAIIFEGYKNGTATTYVYKKPSFFTSYWQRYDNNGINEIKKSVDINHLGRNQDEHLQLVIAVPK